MGRSLVVALLALVGLLCAAGMGYAAYVVSRGSVAVPVTRLQPSPQQLTPAEVRARPKATTTRKHATTTTPTTSTGSATVDDHGGRSGRDGGGSGSGSGSDSGRGGGGHGGDD